MKMDLTIIYKMLLACLAILSPIYGMIGLVLILVGCDWITGTYASIRNKNRIVSSRLRKTIEKFVFYSIGIILGYFFQIYFFSWIPISNIVAGYIATTELISIFENIDSITNLRISKLLKNFKENFIKNIISKK